MYFTSLNELSYTDLIENIYDVNEKLSELMTVVSLVKSKYINDLKIRVHKSFFSTHFYGCLKNTKSDSSTRDSKILLLRLLDSPLIKDYEDELKDSFLGYDFFFDGNEAKGLGFAYLNKTLAFSVNTSEKWREEVELDKESIDDHGEVNSNSVKVRNISSSDHIDNHRQWLEEQKYLPKFNNISEFWNQKESIFENLLFCPSVEKDLSSVKKNPPLFVQIYKVLKNLDKCASNWGNGYFVCDDIISSPESKSREQSLRDELTILCSDNVKRFFTLHAKFTPNEGRMYYYPDKNNHKVHIGYIGRKIGS